MKIFKIHNLREKKKLCHKLDNNLCLLRYHIYYNFRCGLQYLTEFFSLFMFLFFLKSFFTHHKPNHLGDDTFYHVSISTKIH